MNIIKPLHDGFLPQGLSEARRGSTVFTHMLTGTDPLRGRPVGSSGFIASNQEIKSFIASISLIHFMVIPPGSAQNKKDIYFEGGDTVPGTSGPPLHNMMVLLLPSRGLSHWGKPGGGGEISMNARVF